MCYSHKTWGSLVRSMEIDKLYQIALVPGSCCQAHIIMSYIDRGIVLVPFRTLVILPLEYFTLFYIQPIITLNQQLNTLSIVYGMSNLNSPDPWRTGPHNL